MNRRQLKLFTLSIAMIFTVPIVINLAGMISTSFNTSLPPFMKPTTPSSSFLSAPSPFLAWHATDPVSSFFIKLYDVSPLISPIAWTLFLAALFYKGKTKSIWHKNGFDYDEFKTLAKMRGSDTRIKILQNLSLPKNRQQLANEIKLHWRSIDNHVNMLLRFGLIREMVMVGTSTYFIITKKGTDILGLLNNSH